MTSSTSTENNIGNPWTFRIGILNPNYTFPASPLVQSLQPPPDDESTSHMDIDDSDDDDDDDDENDSTNNKAAYLDELSYKYLAYVHCTVVEFTQEEGHVGIPQPIASALLKQANSSSSTTESDEKKEAPIVPSTRTVDPAAQALKTSSEDGDDDNNNENTMQDDNNDGDQTPGHLAWGAFDIPDVKLEVTKVKLPKGRGCTLVPTKEAIQNNFYGLKDVKLVLEQSLIRSRATLSVGDIVATWHRGVKFDLNVTKVIPSLYNSVTCINTDIEVDIGEVESDEGTVPNDNMNVKNDSSAAMETSSRGTPSLIPTK